MPQAAQNQRSDLHRRQGKQSVQLMVFKNGILRRFLRKILPSLPQQLEVHCASKYTNQKLTMNPINPSSDPISTSNGLNRRSFMKKSALTAGAITLLGQGIGFAQDPSSPSSGVVKQPFILIVQRQFFIPGASVVPYPVDEGTTGTFINETTIDSEVWVSATKVSEILDAGPLNSNNSQGVLNYKGSGKNGYIYDVTVDFIYQNVVK